MILHRFPSCVLQTSVVTFYMCKFRLTHTTTVLGDSQSGMDDTPRRAVMYCPGDDIRKVRKGLSSKADCIVLDCEDGVAINRKGEARATIKEIFNGNILPSRPEVAVRVNSVDSGLCEEDLAVVLSANNIPALIFLPKVESKENLQWFADKFDTYMKKNVSVKLIFYAESARSIIDLPEICKAAVDLSKKHRLIPVGLVFGSDDLCANIGAARSVDGSEIMYARQRLVLVAKAFGLQAIDMVHINYKDLKSLREQSEAGARLGYTGKQVIHPDQIEIVQTAFLPSPEKVQWAKGVVQKFQLGQQQGKGAVVYEGSMIDMPLLRQAEHIIKLSEVDKI